MALVFPGEGFRPIIVQHVMSIQSAGLYRVNMMSVEPDNATLSAAGIDPVLSELQIKVPAGGLVMTGGILIQGNIPDIIYAGEIRIKSKE